MYAKKIKYDIPAAPEKSKTVVKRIIDTITTQIYIRKCLIVVIFLCMNEKWKYPKINGFLIYQNSILIVNIVQNVNAN